MGILRKIMFVPILLAVSGCGYLGVTPGAGGSGSGWALPWDTSASPSHEIICAYDGEGITSAGTAGPTSGCSNHVNGSSTYTQDGDAIDFDMHTGDAVLSVAGGIVRWAGTSSSGWSCYGKAISIDTLLPDGSIATALYAHLDSIDVSSGQQVAQGQKIATSGSSGGGSSGCSYGPHLHFALYTDANYTAVNGSSIPALALWATGGGVAQLVSSPPYGGTARLPEPWINCARSSTLSTPPAGEDGSCTDIHAGDVLSRAG
jgi:murein DD-endopeptidase MepM/ murein hydrolase activator NlpD